MAKIIRALMWNEGRHEQSDEAVQEVYPQGIHGQLAAQLNAQPGITCKTALLDDPEHGLTEEALTNTDVLLWWAHLAHSEVQDEIVQRVKKHVLCGLGLICLHSAHYSKVFQTMMGTSGSLCWREIGEKERVWNIEPGHPITAGIGDYIELPHTEMYGERFDIPTPEKLIFISWYQGGNVFRSGCTWERGLGRIFYFSPGHETLPIYHHPDILRVITNAVNWAAPRLRKNILECPNVKELEPVPQ